MYIGIVKDGAHGASRAFKFKDRLRIKEIEKIINYVAVPGTLNVTLNRNFDWESHLYLEGFLTDLQKQGDFIVLKGPRLMRFYPIQINNFQAHAVRFKDAPYQLNFMEIISFINLRNQLKIKNGDKVRVESCA